MNIKNLIEAGENVQVVVSTNDLREFFLSLLENFQATQETKKEDVRITSEEAEKQLGVKATTLWRWARAGYIKPLKIGKRVYYFQSDIDKLTKKA